MDRTFVTVAVACQSTWLVLLALALLHEVIKVGWITAAVLLGPMFPSISSWCVGWR